MTHKYNEFLRGITLPGKHGIVTGRVHNWLSEKSDDIEPVSCWVIGLEYPVKYTALNVCQLFKKLAWKLQANAGVNVCLEGLDDIIREIVAFKYGVREDIAQSGSVKCVVVESEVKNLIPADGYYKVADSLRLESETSKAKFPNHISIYDAWLLAWESILKGDHIILDFSEVRDVDDYSSGRESFIEIIHVMVSFLDNPSVFSFLTILSSINGCIKRGGFRKHGAVTTCLKSSDARINEYLDIPFGQLPYVKKAVAFDKFPPIDLLEKILQKYNNGELFLDKYFGKNANGVELRSNVCRGIFLSPDDQCLIAHVNLGMIEAITDIPKAFAEVTTFLIEVFNLQESLGYQTIDRQIAVGVVGLANFLRNHHVTYQEFIEAMALFNRGFYKSDKAHEIVTALQIGFNVNARLAEANNLRASLTIEPSESCARRYKDLRGFDLCPNIDPPDVISGVGVERRHSQTGIKDEEGKDITPIFSYGYDIQVATELTSREHFYLWNEMQIMMDQTGKQHAACYEHWDFSSTPLDMIGFFEWYGSNLKTLYYFRRIGTKHLQKGTSISSSRGKWKAAMQSETCKIDDPMHCESCGD